MKFFKATIAGSKTWGVYLFGFGFQITVYKIKDARSILNASKALTLDEMIDNDNKKYEKN